LAKDDFEEQVVTMSDIATESVHWLWRPYVPLGKLTILEGDPGLGKTWLALTLAAIVSTGSPFPSIDGTLGERRPAADVLYLTAEDGLGDTLRPRLDSAGADCTRVHALTGKKNPDTEEILPILSIGLDYIYIENAIDNLHPSLVVIDPLQAYLGAAVDMHRANEVRPVLAKLVTLAERYNCAMLLIRHLGKAQTDRAIYRGLGSIDFVAAARSVLMIGQEPDVPAKRAIIQTKNSLATVGPAIGYEIREGKFYCIESMLILHRKAIFSSRRAVSSGRNTVSGGRYLILAANAPATAGAAASAKGKQVESILVHLITPMC
jgi:hypothetical protein